VARRALVSGGDLGLARDANRLTLELAADSIYDDTLVRLTVLGVSPFALRLSGARPIDVRSGSVLDDGSLKAEPAGDRYKVNARVDGWVRERPVADPGREGPEHRYGMRYYPFVSSELVGGVHVEGGSLEHLVVDLPERFRLIWFGQNVRGEAIANDDQPKEPRHSQGQDRSQFTFSWSRDRCPSAVTFEVPVRLGAAALGELVLFPALYLTLSLLGIALAALAASTSVVIAAIGTTWTFALRQWTNARLPQQSTLLTAGYVLAAVFILVWGVAWEWLRWPAAGLGLILVAGLFYIQRAVRQFRGSGALPASVVRPWRAYIAGRVAKDRVAARRG
jgi:hypothetical protein